MRASLASPQRILATRLRIDAQLAAVLLCDEERRPARWRQAEFAREVARCRGHLRPIQSQAQLMSSFRREAMRSSLLQSPADRASRGRLPAIAYSPVELAYAIRWLELRHRRSLPNLD